jgi:hypothetical protein
LGWVSAIDSAAERSGLLTRIAATESGSSCVPMKSKLRLWNCKGRYTFAVSLISQWSRRNVRADEKNLLSLVKLSVKTVTFLVALMVVSCAGEEKVPAMAGLCSAAIFHTESEAKPLPMAARRGFGVLLASLKSPLCSCVSITLSALLEDDPRKRAGKWSTGSNARKNPKAFSCLHEAPT